MKRLSLLLLCAVSLGAQAIDEPQSFRAKRASSYRENGANMDAKSVAPGEAFTIADIRGAGRIVHTWMTLAINDPEYLNNIWIKMYWDGASEPAVEAPFGDFHALGHGVGLEIHEEPFMRSKVSWKFRKGMVVTVEPGLYYHGLGGCRIEDVVHVVPGGSELISRAPYKWEIP